MLKLTTDTLNTGNSNQFWPNKFLLDCYSKCSANKIFAIGVERGRLAVFKVLDIFSC